MAWKPETEQSVQQTLDCCNLIHVRELCQPYARVFMYASDLFLGGHRVFCFTSQKWCLPAIPLQGYRELENYLPVGLLSGDLAALIPTATDSECEGLCAGLASAQSCLCLYQGCRPLLSTKVALALQMDFCHFFPPSYIFYCYHIFMYCLAVFFLFLFRCFWSPEKSSLLSANT